MRVSYGQSVENSITITFPLPHNKRDEIPFFFVSFRTWA